jgi:hypothetical protein
MQAFRLQTDDVRLLFYRVKGDKSTDEGHVSDMTVLNRIVRKEQPVGAPRVT